MCLGEVDVLVQRPVRRAVVVLTAVIVHTRHADPSTLPPLLSLSLRIEKGIHASSTTDSEAAATRTLFSSGSGLVNRGAVNPQGPLASRLLEVSGFNESDSKVKKKDVKEIVRKAYVRFFNLKGKNKLLSLYMGYLIIFIRPTDKFYPGQNDGQVNKNADGPDWFQLLEPKPIKLN